MEQEAPGFFIIAFGVVMAVAAVFLLVPRAAEEKQETVWDVLKCLVCQIPAFFLVLMCGQSYYKSRFTVANTLVFVAAAAIWCAGFFFLCRGVGRALPDRKGRARQPEETGGEEGAE